MADVKQARLLLTMAQKDLRALQAMGDHDAFAEEIFGFHVQQAIEKVLKAWLALLGRQAPRTHMLSMLLDLLEQNGQAVEQYWDLIEYQIFAVQLRYETAGSDADRLDRQHAVKEVSRLLD